MSDNLVPDETDYKKYRGKCKEMSEHLVAQDPALRLVRGHYYDYDWGVQQHWWCERPDGTVVDPTKGQFPSKGAGIYEEFNGIVTCEECGVELKEEDAAMCGNYPVCSDYCACRLVGIPVSMLGPDATRPKPPAL